ncbi:MAG: hypothetical protein ACKOLA_04195 [Spartobacteria bacterium]
MDALTNVVAVLIFVLLLVNCDVAQTVVKIMEDIVPVSEEEMKQVQDMLKQLDLDAKRLEELKKQPQPDKLEFEELQKAIEALKKLKEEKLKKIEAHDAAHAELQKRHDEAQAARDTEQQKNVAMQEEIRRLEILLDTTPVEKDIPATDITIPATRPIPEGAKTYYAYVVKDRVHLVDPDNVLEIIRKKVDSLKSDKNLLAPEAGKTSENEDGEKKSAAERRAEREKEKADAKKEKPVIFERDKLTPVLKGLDFKLPKGQTADFHTTTWWSNYHLIVNFSPTEGGATLEELKQPSNPFTSALSKVRPNEVVMFRVSPESMYTYAVARELVDKKQIPCGWELVGPEKGGFMQDYFRLHLEGVTIKPTATPPPPPKELPKRAREVGGKLD